MGAVKEKIKIFGPNPQGGVALVIAVLILLVLTVIGVYAITTATFETKIAGFGREFKEAFYTADSGEPIGIDVIKAIIHYVPSTRSDLPDSCPWKTVGVIHNSLFTEIFTDGITDTDNDVDPQDGRNDDVVRDSSRDMEFTGPQIGFHESSHTQLRADIDRLASYQITGGAQQFASGYEGIGSGGGGSVGIIYEIDSVGRYPYTYTNAQSELEAGYRYVVGVAGGN